MVDAVVFSLARLGAPSLDLETPAGLRFRVDQDLVHDGLAVQRSAMPAMAASDPLGFAGRVQQLDGVANLQQRGVGSGLLTLPQTFGAVYLGQAFAATVTACNHSSAAVSLVGIKVELSTERSKPVALYDGSSQPLPSLAPGQRHEFTIRHDLKDLGTHSLVCTASYVAPDGERRLQSQAFNFGALNPLVVRTKQRQVGEVVLLEATVENATKAPMLLDALTFFPSPAYTAQRIGSGGTTSPRLTGGTTDAGPLSSYIQSLPLIPEGGSSAFLFRLTKLAAGAAGGPTSSGPGSSAGGSSSSGSGSSMAGLAAAAAAEASGALGKLEIRWRGPMGQMARLQTQQISLPPQQTPREASLTLARLPRRVVVGVPFVATLRVKSQVDRQMGPLRIQLASDPTAPPGSAARLGSSRRATGESAYGTSSRDALVQAASGIAANTGSGGLLPQAVGIASSSSSTGSGAGGGSAGSGGAAAAGPQHQPLTAVTVCLDGPQAVVLSELPARQALEVRIRLLALATGQQSLPAFALVNERDGKLCSALPPVELFVDSS